MTTIIPKGTVIICPRKGHLVAVANRDIQSGSLVKLTDFAFEPGQKRIAGEPMQCRHKLPDGSECASLYFKQCCIHTKTGWMPKDPLFEPTI